jgi:deoxyribodipyrimidine photo-lyase
MSRLNWHCHFIQKLESEPEIEFRNLCRLYDGLREDEFNNESFEAWKRGTTGFPMIDACMRYLHHHRWINFRMRAMLMSFAAYHLWLHWREPSIFLAKQFLDFEPGIHFSQCQMQSGVTGINTIRIYSPSKQLLDQDPTGEFVRRWVPELEHVPLAFLAEPHRMSIDDQVRYRCRIGVDYPCPIVDDKTAVRYAKERIYAIRQTDEAKDAAAKVFLKHGSRKRQFRDPLPEGSTGKPTSVRKPAVKRRKDNNDKQPRLPGMEDF